MSCPVKSKSAEVTANSTCPITGKSAVDGLSSLVSDSVPKHNEGTNDILFDSQRQSGQSAILSTERYVSTIPKTENSPAHQPEGVDNRVYPSEQQYYNAMKKKGYNPPAEDIPVILAIHNSVNEQGWTKILEWEAFRGCREPKLKRFMGRPNDLSPKARLLTFMG